MEERIEGGAIAKTERVPRKFPYYPLEFAIDLVEKVYKEAGGSADKGGVAELIGLKRGSSSLEMRIISAAMFGLVERREGRVVLTRLGRLAAAPTSPAERSAALIQAMNHVELFQKIRERFAGQPLPSEAGMKVMLARDFGVPEAHRNDAYNILMRSAKEAGILVTRSSGIYLTTIPSRAHADDMGDSSDTEESNSVDSGEGHRTFEPQSPAERVHRKGLHPSISGLVDEMASDAASWDAEKRGVWESALRAVLDYVYPESRKPSA